LVLETVQYPGWPLSQDDSGEKYRATDLFIYDDPEGFLGSVRMPKAIRAKLEQILGEPEDQWIE